MVATSLRITRAQGSGLLPGRGCVGSLAIGARQRSEFRFHVRRVRTSCRLCLSAGERFAQHVELGVDHVECIGIEYARLRQTHQSLGAF